MKYIDILLESFDIKSKDWDYEPELRKELIANGYNKIGEGDYSDIYGHPSKDTVIKIRADLGSTKIANPNREIKFYKLCLKSNNPYLPKVSNLKRIDYWYYIEIEKLTKLTSEYEKLIYRMVNSSMLSYSDEEFVSEFSEITDEEKIEMLLGLKNTILFVINTLKINPEFADFGNVDNFMMRGNQIVITDPYR